MANNQFINLEELSKTAQALLSKINEQSNLKVNKANVSAEYSEGTKIADIEDIEIYAPEIDMSNYPTMEMLENLADFATNYNNLVNAPELATVAISGSYNDLNNKPDTSTFMIKGTDYVTAGKKSGTTLGTNATAEGNNNTASGYGSHAEGDNNTASGYGSHAEGRNNTASGYYSHVEGSNNTASGYYSHAEGYHTIAQRTDQHVFGKYNIADTTGNGANAQGKYIEIVGNGQAENTRSNARTLDWDGNEILAGKLTVGTAPTANMDVTTKQYVDNKITTDIATAIGNINQFEVAIVANLPTTNIDTHTIYFKSNSSSGNNIYDEYMYINSNWELIGSTQIDLTPYALSANLATVATSGDYDDLTDAPVAETDANVEDMLDNFDLDYTSNTLSPNMWQGGSY